MKIYPSLENWTHIGTLSGGSDIKGYLHIKEEKEVKWKKGMFLLIEKDGLYVPFEVKDFYLKNDIPYIKLHLFPLNNILKWKNASVLAENKQIYKQKETDSLIGYEVIDENSGTNVGVIHDFREYSLNKILILKNNHNKEILIPFQKDLISRITERKIYMKLPEKLTEINNA